MWSLFTIKDAIDIILVATLLYYVFRMMRRTGSINIFVGILTIIGIWIIVSKLLSMRLIGSLMDKFISVGALIFVILFQDEIRRFLIGLGSHKRWKHVFNIFRQKSDTSKGNSHMAIVLAARNMAKSKTGALIVIEGETDLRHYSLTGERIDANINTRLIENIFFKNSPLHDGAMIISNNRISAVGAILPVAHSNHLPKEMGLRHRAAIGISQITDAKVIVVSEERGKISFAYKGELSANISEQELEELLTQN